GWSATSTTREYGRRRRRSRRFRAGLGPSPTCGSSPTRSPRRRTGRGGRASATPAVRRCGEVGGGTLRAPRPFGRGACPNRLRSLRKGHVVREEAPRRLRVEPEVDVRRLAD